ncbi:MAG: DEAD/DEAH box helicase [Patescibacteria group bacterium]|nr:DEAD/DEAH box helicase [Patescibacteria group bacterium]
MSFGESSYRMFEPKSLEELETQVQESESFWEQSLIPAEHRENTEEIMHMSVEEIKEKYPARYKIYLQSLRELKSLEKGRDGLMSLKELDVLKMRLRMLNNLDEYVHNISNGEKETHLREHQVSVFEKLRDFLESGGSSGYIELPTGTGKTVIFIEFLRVLDVPVVIVVPTKDLIKQTKARLDQFADNLDVGAVYSKAKEYGSRVLLTTYDSLPNLIKHEKFDLDKIGLAILDEVHESLSKKRSEVVEKLKEASIVIGLTATSEYSDTKNVGELLDNKIHEMSLIEAIESGALSPCSAMVATTKIDISKVKIKSNGDYDEEELSKAINIEARNKAVTEMATTTFAGKQKILFCGSIDHAEELCKRINKAGEVAEVVVGETQDKVEEKYINLGFKGGWKEAYKKGVIKAILSVSLLTRGTDLPSAEICMNVSPTTSLVKAKQRGGRVTRLDPNNPNKHAIVVDFVDLGEDGKKSGNSILFYEILGDTVVLPRVKKNGGESEGLENKVNEGIVDEDKKGFFEKPIIEGVEIIVDLEVMKMLVYRKKETEEEIIEKYREIVKGFIVFEDFLKMTSRERDKFKIEIDHVERTVRFLSRIFGVNGDPVSKTNIHMELARKIYGDKKFDDYFLKYEELQRKHLVEAVRSQITVDEWFGRDTFAERSQIKATFDGLEVGLKYLSGRFGFYNNPATNDRYIELAKEIYGVKEVEEALERKKEVERNICSEAVKSQITVAEWFNKKEKNKNFEIKYGDKTISLVTLGSIFGIKGNPVVNIVFVELSKKIFGEEVVDEILSNYDYWKKYKTITEKNIADDEILTEIRKEELRKIIKSQITVDIWVNNERNKRSSIKVKVDGLEVGLKYLSVRFGFYDDPAIADNYIELAKEIYGVKEVEEALERKKEVERNLCSEAIKSQITLNEWLFRQSVDRRKILVMYNGKNTKLPTLANIFGIDGNPYAKATFIKLTNKIYGEDAVNEALDKNK